MKLMCIYSTEGPVPPNDYYPEIVDISYYHEYMDCTDIRVTFAPNARTLSDAYLNDLGNHFYAMSFSVNPDNPDNIFDSYHLLVDMDKASDKDVFKYKMTGRLP